MGFTTWHAFPKLRAGASIFLFLFATTVRSLAARVDPVRICLRNDCDHSTSDAVVHAIQTALQKRKLSVRYLASHWILHYHELTPFAPSWNVAFGLGYFWAQMPIQLSSMTEEHFQKNRAWRCICGWELMVTTWVGLQLEVFKRYGLV